MEFGPVVEVQGFGLAAHRPIDFDTNGLEPGALVTHLMGQAQTHGDRRGGLQGDDHTEQTPAVVVDGHAQIGSSDRLAVVLVDHDQIHRGMVDLHPLERRRGLGSGAGGRLQGAGGLRAVAFASHLAKVQGGDAQGHRVAGRDR
jgi:hypothetical protein